MVFVLTPAGVSVALAPALGPSAAGAVSAGGSLGAAASGAGAPDAELQPYDNLLILREDLRDPVLRSRGVAWKIALSRALDDCFHRTSQKPRGIGLLMAAQWQGSLVWWSFEPRETVEDFVRESLKNFLSSIIRLKPATRRSKRDAIAPKPSG